MISAWLASRIAHKAIDKAEPENIPLVIDALSGLLVSLRQFLPWAGQVYPDRQADLSMSRPLQRGTNEDPDSRQEADNEEA